MGMQEVLYKSYIETTRGSLLQTTESKPVQVGEVRLLLMEHPEWILIADKVNENLYTIVPLPLTSNSPSLTSTHQLSDGEI